MAGMTELVGRRRPPPVEKEKRKETLVQMAGNERAKEKQLS